MALLELHNVSRKENGIDALKSTSFSIEAFQKVAIAGETGSGKTTLLKLIAGLAQPTTGEILFENERVEGPLEKLLPGHPRIAYHSQHFELRNNYRVEEELESKNLLSQEEADKIYSICRIQHLLKRKTNQLSGGERQRIVLARLLTTLPKLLLLDEPFSNLDAVHKKIIQSVIHDIGSKMKITCIMVSHDAPDILSWADHIIIMKDGTLIQQGTPQEIYYKPLDEYCASLFGSYNILNVDGKKLLLRPEQLKIVDQHNGSIEGIVEEISFWGNYYTVTLLIDKQLITVQTHHHHFTKGEKIFISYNSNNNLIV